MRGAWALLAVVCVVLAPAAVTGQQKEVARFKTRYGGMASSAQLGRGVVPTDNPNGGQPLLSSSSGVQAKEKHPSSPQAGLMHFKTLRGSKASFAPRGAHQGVGGWMPQHNAMSSGFPVTGRGDIVNEVHGGVGTGTPNGAAQHDGFFNSFNTHGSGGWL